MRLILLVAAIIKGLMLRPFRWLRSALTVNDFKTAPLVRKIQFMASWLRVGGIVGWFLSASLIGTSIAWCDVVDESFVCEPIATVGLVYGAAGVFVSIAVYAVADDFSKSIIETPE